MTRPDLPDSSEIPQLGQTLQRINQPMNPSQVSGGTKVWYQGGEPYFDLTLEVLDDEVVSLMFTLRGYFVMWDSRSNAVKTGRTSEPEIPGVSYYAASTTLTQSNTADTELIAIAQAILRTKPDDPLRSQAADRLGQFL